jgi:hypothetical protein
VTITTRFQQPIVAGLAHQRQRASTRLRGWRARIAAIGLVASVLAVSTMHGASAAGALPPAPPSTGLRIATFNTGLLSPAMRCLPDLTDPESGMGVIDFFGCLGSDVKEQHAQEIADALVQNASHYDVLALNEVWDEDAKDILVNALKSLFPNYVKKIDLPITQSEHFDVPGADDDFQFNFEDSGLMLFAKPFLSPVNLPKLPPGSPVYIGSGADAFPLPPSGMIPFGTVQGTIPHVAFTAFGTNCEIEDCLAAKGAGLVRFRNSKNGTTVNVAFSHMQADSSDDQYPAVRQAQLTAIANLIAASLHTSQLGSEQLYVVGDLNVPGEGDVIQTPAVVEGTGEWSAPFGDPSSFFKSTVHDSWALTTSAKDVGITQTGNARIDYIAANRLLPGSLGWTPASIVRGFCVQHLTIQLKNLPSDHSLVAADTNSAFHYCNPRSAWVNPPKDGFLDANSAAGPGDTTRIQFPGSMQWFHVINDVNAAYDIGSSDNALAVTFDVFAPENLSKPIAPYKATTDAKMTPEGQPYTTLQYVLPSEFYVRYRAAATNATGDYQPFIHQLRCDRISEACPLQPGQPQLASFPSNQPLGPDDMAWFRIDVNETPDSGVAQTIKAVVDQFDAAKFTVTLSDVNAPNVPLNVAPAIDSDSVTHGLDLPGAASFYLTIARDSPRATSGTVRAGWTSNLTVMQLGSLTCIDETNGFAGSEAGVDEINAQFTVDGVSHMLWPDEHDYDCDTTKDEKDVSWKTMRFLDDVAVQLREDDSPDGYNTSPTVSVVGMGAALSPTQTSGSHYFEWYFEGGEYELDYQLARRSNTSVLP